MTTSRPLDVLLFDTAISLATLDSLAELPPSPDRDRHLDRVGEVFAHHWTS